jgi:hypothetical protein
MNIFLSIFNFLQYIYYKNRDLIITIILGKINKNYFIQSNGYDMIMSAKLQYLNMYAFL